MKEILYRIYEVSPKRNIEDESDDIGSIFRQSYSQEYNSIIFEDCMVCESRDHFKEIIRSTYGDNIKFSASKKYDVGTKYCIIIGESAYRSQRYFARQVYECANCGVSVQTWFDNNDNIINDYECRNELANKFKLVEGKKFCGFTCKYKHLAKLKAELTIDDDTEFFATKEMFINGDIEGYIYKITNTVTADMYIGQSRYIPPFRWVQHLRSNRFKDINIVDLRFEVLEVVNKGINLLKREEMHIKKAIAEGGKLLNIVHNVLD